MRSFLVVPCVLASVVTFALAGCGEESEEPPPASVTVTATATPEATSTVESTPSATPATSSPTPTPSPTPTSSPTPTETSTETPVVTPTPTSTPLPTEVATEVPTETATATEPPSTPPPVVTQPVATLPPTPAPSGGGVTANIHGFGYPYELHVAPGTTVTWVNQDAVTHDVAAFDGSWGSALFGQGQSYSHTFGAAGRYPYTCTVHPYMQAVVVVE